MNGVDYDSDKNADTVEDGLDYDRSPSAAPNPPWEAGPPDGAVTMADVLAVQPQVGRNCIGAPEEASVTYGYDDNGNQTSRGADTFAYDHENRLTQAVVGGVTSSSTYNGDGLRMSHTVGGATTNYTWDTAAELPVVLQDGTNTYVYGMDLISTTDGAGSQTYHLYDGLGSTVGLAGEDGNPVDGYTYDVFGSIRSQSGSSLNYWLFTGEQNDPNGLIYLRARYYDPAVGRFLSQDPVFGTVPVSQSLDRYTYVVNNPVRFVDLTGLSREGPTPKPLRPPTPPCEAVPGATCCYTPDEPWGFICGVGHPSPGAVLFEPAGDFLTCQVCASIGQGIVAGLECTTDPNALLAAGMVGSVAGPEAGAGALLVGCTAVGITTGVTDVNPLSPP